jgi:hypothetical protein
VITGICHNGLKPDVLTRSIHFAISLKVNFFLAPANKNLGGYPVIGQFY